MENRKPTSDHPIFRKFRSGIGKILFIRGDVVAPAGSINLDGNGERGIEEMTRTMSDRRGRGS
jgi:hypothetical protein